jgi:hypothetical protein
MNFGVSSRPPTRCIYSAVCLCFILLLFAYNLHLCVFQSTRTCCLTRSPLVLFQNPLGLSSRLEERRVCVCGLGAPLPGWPLPRGNPWTPRGPTPHQGQAGTRGREAKAVAGTFSSFCPFQTNFNIIECGWQCSQMSISCRTTNKKRNPWFESVTDIRHESAIDTDRANEAQ